MMTKKLSRHGNSRAIVIEKPILDLLGIDENTMLQLHTDGESLILSPVIDEERAAKIRSVGQKFHDKYETAMRELAGDEDSNPNIEQALEEGNARFGGMLKNLA